MDQIFFEIFLKRRIKRVRVVQHLVEHLLNAYELKKLQKIGVLVDFESILGRPLTDALELLHIDARALPSFYEFPCSFLIVPKIPAAPRSSHVFLRASMSFSRVTESSPRSPAAFAWSP